MWQKNDDGHTIFHVAISHRHLDIYKLLYEIGSKQFVTTKKDNKGNNILRLIGLTTKKAQVHSMSVASLAIQRELLWFKDVEKMVIPSLRYSKNVDGHTAYELFLDNNKELASSGLPWMKEAMIVAALIVTMSFAALFTPPGGYNQHTGFLLFIDDVFFLVFFFANGVSLLTSSISLMACLSILTSQFGPSEYLFALPKKLILALVTLFIAVVTICNKEH